tara:strand:+ start:251 stop:1315 length:1065 start_codon:yes stop_codon:yes gene_type:complete
MDMEEGAQPTAAQANVVVQATVVRATVETAAAQTVASVAAVDKMTMSAEVQAPAAEEAPRSAEEGGRSAKRSRPRGPTPVWGKTEPSWDGVAWVDESGNQRPKDQRSREKNARRRTPEAQVANAAAERKRKARKKEEALLKEEEQKLEQQVLPGAEAPACAAEGPQLPGAAVHEDMLTRKKGYDTTNNLNKLLTQGFSCSIPDRNKKKLFSTLIMKINALEEHDLMSKYQAVMVATETMGDVSVVDVLRLVRKELECKEPHVSPRPPPTPPRPSETDVRVPEPPCLYASDACLLLYAGQTARLLREIPEATEGRAARDAWQGHGARHAEGHAEGGGDEAGARGRRVVDRGVAEE